MFLDIYLGFVSALLTVTALNFVIIKVQQYRLKKRQEMLNSIHQQYQQQGVQPDQSLILKQPTRH